MMLGYLVYFSVLNIFILHFHIHQLDVLFDKEKSDSSKAIFLEINIQKDASVIYYDEWGGYAILSNGLIELENNFNNFEIVAQTKDKKYVFLFQSGDTIRLVQNGGLFTVKSTEIKEKALNFYQQYVVDNDIKKNIAKPDFTIDVNNIDKSLKQREYELDSSLNFQLVYLKNYQIKHQLPDSFYTLWKNYFICANMEKKLFIAPNGKAVNALPEWYHQELLNTVKFFNEKHLIYLREYQSAARLLLYYLGTKSSGGKQIQQESSLALINKDFTGYTKDFLLLLHYQSLTGKNAPPVTSARLLDHFEEKSIYKDALAKRLAFAETITSTDLQLVNWEGQSVSIESIRKKDSKILYLDFWASWCGPCRVEMPHSRKLKEEYGKKGVQLIYVSLDEDLNAWQRANRQLTMEAGESFLTTWKSPLPQKFKIKEIPRYMILDETGKVLVPDAPRPGSTEIRKLFDDYLKNK